MPFNDSRLVDYFGGHHDSTPEQQEQSRAELRSRVERLAAMARNNLKDLDQLVEFVFQHGVQGSAVLKGQTNKNELLALRRSIALFGHWGFRAQGRRVFRQLVPIGRLDYDGWELLQWHSQPPIAIRPHSACALSDTALSCDFGDSCGRLPSREWSCP
jgi:hypothetical protein